MRHARRLPLLLTLVLLLPGSLEAQKDSPTLTLDDYLDWEWVSDPRVSPDGSQILYTRSRVDAVNDRRASEVWLMNADGSKKRFLVEGSGARWSPDGTRIAFTAAGEPRGSQIFVRWMDAEGAVSQITRVENPPSGLRWSPDGEHIAFTMQVDTKEPWTVQLPDRPDGAEWTAPPRIVRRATWKADRRGYVDDGYRHVFVVTAEGGTPRQLTEGEWNHSGAEWTPDGREIVFQSLRVENPEDPENWYEGEVYSVEVESGSIRPLTDRRGPDNGPLPSPDGSLIAYTGVDWNDDSYRNEGLYVMERDGSNPRQISGDFDRPMRQMFWASDGSGVYFNAQDRGTVNLFLASVDGGVQPATEGSHDLSVSSLGPDGLAVGTRSGPHEPGDVVRFRLPRGSGPAGPDDLTELTHVNDDVLAGVTLGEVEEIWYDSKDGIRIQGWIVKPPDFDPSQEYPLILQIHGGPHAMYDVGFSFARQEHAARGYVLLYTNPRGSTGYGSPFANAIEHAYPGDDFDDLMNGVDEVIARGYIDEDNLFVYGCSGGGILTSWIVGHTDRFTAASANCPVTNWISLVGTSDAYRYHRNFENWFWDDPSEHLRRSPIMYVGNVTTPTMLMTGEMDLRTPITQTEEYYQALKVRGVPSVMLRFQDEWHGTSSNPSNFLRTQLYLRKWFEQWKRPAAVTEEGG